MLSVKPLNLTPEQKAKTVTLFCEEIERALTARTDMEKQWTLAVKQYNGRLTRENAPAPMANMDIGLTREYSQQSAASLLNPFLQQPTYYTTIPRAPQFEDAARDIDEVLDYICDKAKIQATYEQWVKASHIFHYTFVKVPWIVKKRTIREWKWRDVPVMESVLDEMGMPVIGQDGKPLEQQVIQEVWKQSTDEMGQPAVDPEGSPVMHPEFVPLTEKEMYEDTVVVEDLVGAIPEVVPSEDTIFPMDARDATLSRWFDHRFHLNKLEIRKRLKNPDEFERWEGDVAKADVEEYKPAEFEVEEKKLIGLDISGQKLAECHEIYTTLGELRVMLNDDSIEPDYDDDCELIITIDKTNGQYRRGIHNFYHAYPRPFVGWCYEGRKDGIPGISLCYILQQHHQTYSAMVNQELDAQSAANQKILLYREGSGMEKVFTNHVLKGGAYPYNGNPKEDIFQYEVSQPRTTSPDLRAEIQSHAERLANKNPFSFGQVTTSHISATGQMQQTQEAAQPLYSVLESFRAAAAEVAYMMLARYKQFYPDGMDYFLKKQTDDGYELSPGQIQWPTGAIETSVYVETKVSSSTMNKEMKKQERLALADKYPVMVDAMMKLISASQANPALAPMLTKYINGLYLVLDDLYTEFEVNDKDKLNPNPEAEVMLAQQIQGLVGQLQQLTQENGQLKAQFQGLMSAIQGIAPPGPGGPGAPPPNAGSPQGPPTSPPPPPGPGGGGAPQGGI